MCHIFSCLVFRDRVCVPKNPEEFSHEQIFRDHKLRDDCAGPLDPGFSKRKFTRVEISPEGMTACRSLDSVGPKDLSKLLSTNPATWALRHDYGGMSSSGDQPPPAWWTLRHRKMVEAAIRSWQKKIRAINAKRAPLKKLLPRINDNLLRMNRARGWCVEPVVSEDLQMLENLKKQNPVLFRMLCQKKIAGLTTRR